MIEESYDRIVQLTLESIHIIHEMLIADKIDVENFRLHTGLLISYLTLIKNIQIRKAEKSQDLNVT